MEDFTPKLLQDENQGNDFQSPEEIEFRKKLESPYKLLQKGDFWIEEMFCSNCGEKSYPLIVEKFLLDKPKEYSKTIFTKDHLGNNVPYKNLISVVYWYCEVLKCNHMNCNEIFFRIFELEENETIPQNDKKKIIPKRKDRAPIKNRSDEEPFKKAYSRYCEAINAYNHEYNYSAGASLRSVLEILCKIRGHFQNILNMKTYGKTLQKEQVEKIKRSIGLEDQVKIFIQEIQAIAPETLNNSDVEKIKLMMYWGHGVVHGSVEPDDDELKAGFYIIEEIFRILYFDSIDSEKQRIEQQQKEQRKKERTEKYQSSSEKFKRYG